MATSASPRWRSLLFVPAHVKRFVDRAHERSADGIILDLEDAVPSTEKRAARGALAAAMGRIATTGTAAMVRVNHDLRQVGPDLEAAVVPGLAAIVVPKVEEAGFVREVAHAVADLEAERSLAPGSIRLVLQIETARGVINLNSIATAHPRVAAMTLGPEDYAASIGGVPEEDVLFQPNYEVLLAARAAGIVPLGFVGSIGSYSDIPAFVGMARRARRMGFLGALAVHPSQIALLNEAFTPTAEEHEWARRVVEGNRAARASGRGAFELDGRMVDAPVVRRAEEVLAAIGAISPLVQELSVPSQDSMLHGQEGRH